VGYAGGTTTAPTYRRIGDHTETFQVDYDPARISYRQLLAVFWESHNPTSRSWSNQYKAAVFYHNDAQKQLAMETAEQEAVRSKKMIRTEILPFTGFTIAEGYHQKYYLRREKDLMREFEQIYPSSDDFVRSTAAARVNGYLGGNGTAQEFHAQLALLGLSAEGQNTLAEIFNARKGS
jgi:methionine-S-sulfoxide reductase